MQSMQARAFARLRSGAAPFALLAALSAGPAFAQTAATLPANPSPATAPADDESQDIVVTGTIFRRTNTETPSPVSVLSAATIEQRGLTTVADAINTIAASNGGGIPQNFTGAFASGAQAISLRGLTTNSTLTLFDGLRPAYYPLADDGQRSIVDLNTIPSATVEQIQVVRDGASSTYGADAIAGVVNVITKKEITGINGRVEGGVSQRGDVGSQRVQLTIGHGHLKTDGFNFYLSGEYQHSDPLYNKQRGFPYNTNNLTSINAGNGFTGRDGNTFVTPPSSTSSTGATVAIVRPTTSYVPGVLTSGAAGATGQFQVLGAGGCAAQGLVTHTNAAGTYCEQDLINQYGLIQPEQTRFGGTAHATVDVGNAQAYLSATFYQSRIFIDGTPQSIRSNGNPVETRGIALPALLSNGQLNPNDPFAASGQAALIYYRFGDIPSSLTNVSRTYRIAGGIDGKFGDGFNYSVAATYMRTDLTQTRKGYLNIAGLTAAINNGTYNFVNPSLNTQAVRDSIAPTFDSTANSELWQVQASLTKDLFDLPGGPLQAGINGSVRYEAVYDPNPVALVQAITVNPFSAIGNRYVEGASFEINAPILHQLEVDASGRFDHYSIGFSHFSPKVGAKFTPIKQLSIRGTYSKGFRAPSVPETSGSVIGFTQYTPGGSITDPAAKAALLNAYGNNSYITTQYGLGNNSTGNPAIKPETSRSFTGGIVFEPRHWLSLTVDYYNIEKRNLILSAGGNPASIADQYLLTGAIPAGVTITPNATDPAHPGLRPTPLSINFLYSNGNFLKTSGIDAQIQAVIPLGDGIKFTTALEGTEILNYDIDDGSGVIQHFVGTLASYATTSASGTPRWRANWQNTLDYGPYSLTATTYFTSGYKGYADDNTGGGSTCAQAIETSVKYSADFSTTTTGGALQCTVKHFLSVDLNATVRVNDRFTFYTNVTNLFDAKAPFDPNTYGGNNYNPAWSASGVIGRYFRAGATFKF
jgi:iron complex outermembrane receptor protein